MDCEDLAATGLPTKAYWLAELIIMSAVTVIMRAAAAGVGTNVAGGPAASA